MNARVVSELTALADGSLAPERHIPLLLAVLGSPELARELEQQLHAILAIRSLRTPAPPALRAWIESRLQEAMPEEVMPEEGLEPPTREL